MSNATEKVYSLIKDTVLEQGVELWDVRFVKEGASWYLRIFIDSERGITIEDCTNVSHAIDPIIDEADPIETSYFLEVCSPGLERELIKIEHFKKSIGKKVKIKLFKAYNGTKEFTGILKSADDLITVETDTNTMQFSLKEISKANISEF